MRKSVAVAAGVVSIGVWVALVPLFAQRFAAETYASPVYPDRGAAGLSRLLRELNTRASLILFTAHPDDEDGGMLAYESRGVGTRTALLTLNRGEGGQNVMSTDLYDSLGLVRTQELLLAGRYMGVDQYFTSVVDYGFSKTREEALEKWGHDRVLADVVRVVRTVRPLVITSVFAGAASDGHGNHQVAGQMAQEAFVAAGDPTKFPEQIREGLRPWSPVKVYARAANPQVTAEGMFDSAVDKFVPVKFFDYVNEKEFHDKPSVTVQVQEGLPAPATGLTYSQIAREGLGFQKTQNGGGTLPQPSPVTANYHRYGSRIPAEEKEKSYFDGIDISVRGIATLATGDTQFLKDGLDEISKAARASVMLYSVDQPSVIADQLAAGLKTTRALIDRVNSSSLAEPGKSDVLFELRVKEDQFEKAMAASLELMFDTTVANENAGRGRGGRGAAAGGQSPGGRQPTAAEQAMQQLQAGRGGRGGGPTFTIAIPGQTFGIEAVLFNQSPENVAVESVDLTAADGKNWNIRPVGEPAKVADAGKLTTWRFSTTVPQDAAFTRPYYSRPDEEQPYYNIDDPRYRTLPVAPYPLTVHVRASYHGVPFEIAEVVQASERVPGIGTLQNPLLVGPAISVSVSPSAGAVPMSSKSFNFHCTVHSNVKGPAQGMLRLKLPAGWRSNPAQAPFQFERDGEDQTIAFAVTPDIVKPADYTIQAIADYNGKSYTEGYHLTGYPGLRAYPFYRPATYKAVGVDVKTAPGMTLGFLPGTGDDVPKALTNLGQNVRILDSSDVTHGDLAGYDAIILGTRAYAVRADLKAANARLLDYVKNGGVLIVQYNLQDFDHNYGPYPFTLGSNPQKVVDENSPVALLDPNSPALRWPNKITEADFKGWVEERGHGFLRSWDQRYQPLVEVHDPDQDPQKGGLLLARYGKGFYIYDAFALYRQLPSGVPGAFRLLANLVSLGKNPEWK